MRRSSLLWLALLTGCGTSSDVMKPEDRGTRLITMPSGDKVRFEIRVRPADVVRGVMFRDELPKDRGVALFHQKAGSHPTFMYQVKIPVDHVWIDGQGRVVEVVASVPPCPPDLKASQCPVYGGQRPSKVILLLADGMAARYGLLPGVKVDL